MDRKSYPTWQWVAVTSVGAVGVLVLLAFADTRESIKELQHGKADQSLMLSLEERQRSMDDKLDFIIQMHIDDNGDIVRMRLRK